MGEDEEKTIREYRLIFRSGRLHGLENEISGLYNNLDHARQSVLNEQEEQRKQEELKALGYESYVDKKLSEDSRLKDEEGDSEEKKEKNKYYRQLAKELLIEYK